MYVPLDPVLLRAPLLPVAALRRDAGRALLKHPLGARAIALASPALAAARPGAARDRAVARYARRAAFRPTPHGLLAGVFLGRLGRTTAIATGTPEARHAPRWAAVDARARRALDEPAIRERVRLRLAPSVARGATHLRWIGPGDPFGETREAELDSALRAIADVAVGWIAWPEVRARLTDDLAHGGDVDDLLLTLIDDGLLTTDLAPPLVGPPPERHLADRLAALGLPADTGADADEPEAAVLVHRPRLSPLLARSAVERAARLAPTLFGLQEALAPPASERLAQPALADALDAVTEVLGAGAFDLEALAAGDYGVDPAGGGGDEAPADRAPPTRVLALIVDAVTAAAGARRQQAALDPVALEAALAEGGQAAPPPTGELFLAPAPAGNRRGARPGDGWLLGLHAPAGSSLGRFAHALGPPMTDALQALAAAEARARPDEEAVDVAFAPSPALADLTAHPRIRRRTLALSRWGGDDDLALRDLQLVADPEAPSGLALRERRGGHPIVPAPLARVRSATAPAGIARLLVGWSLGRQHAPWALPLGPLAKLTFVPRLTLDGFVISPASWRLPAAGASRAEVARWRKELRVPRLIQVGEGDELLPVDLDAPDAAADLAGHGRAFEIWPPLAGPVDRDGRRVEAVVLLVDQPDAAAAAAGAAASAAIRRAGEVPPPSQAGAAPGWRTYKLFGTEGRQDQLLATAVAPVVAAARSAGEIDRWFFLRYVDGPGRRPHVRLRVHAPGGASAFEARLGAARDAARGAGLLTAVEIGEYWPERGRFPAAELDAIHALFESDSALACALLEDPTFGDDLGRIADCARAVDALAGGLGYDLEARHGLARARRRAAEADGQIDEDARRAADLAFRAVGRDLRQALAAPPAGSFADHARRVAGAAEALPDERRAALFPTLAHLCAVRLLGPDREGERLALTFWERVLGGLLRARR